MVKLIVGAVAAVAAIAAAAVLANETGAAHGWVVAGAVASAIVVPLAGYTALRTLVAMLPPAAREQITLVVATVVAALEAVVATSDSASGTKLTLAVLVAVAGAAGLWTRVTPVENPKANDGTPLVPVDTVEPGMPRRPTL